MPPSYVIVMQSDDGTTAQIDLVCNDDVHAIVAARRLFVQEIVTTQREPLSLTVGRNVADGEVLWLSTWNSSPTVAPESEPSSAAPAWRGRRPLIRRPAQRSAAKAMRGGG